LQLEKLKASSAAAAAAMQLRTQTDESKLVGGAGATGTTADSHGATAAASNPRAAALSNWYFARRHWASPGMFVRVTAAIQLLWVVACLAVIPNTTFNVSCLDPAMKDFFLILLGCTGVLWAGISAVLLLVIVRLVKHETDGYFIKQEFKVCCNFSPLGDFSRTCCCLFVQMFAVFGCLTFAVTVLCFGVLDPGNMVRS
jgi:hypothetical protein